MFISLERSVRAVRQNKTCQHHVHSVWGPDQKTSQHIDKTSEHGWLVDRIAGAQRCNNSCVRQGNGEGASVIVKWRFSTPAPLAHPRTGPLGLWAPSSVCRSSLVLCLSCSFYSMHCRRSKGTVPVVAFHRSGCAGSSCNASVWFHKIKVAKSEI